MKKELWRSIYTESDRVYLHAARIIGYAGCSPTAFWDAAKLLPNYDKRKYEAAMEDLTSWNSRQPPSLRYELNATARKCVRALLGLPPGAPDFDQYWSREVLQPGMTEPHVPKKPETKKPARKEAPKKKPAKTG